MDMDALITVQEMFPYFEMLNGPTFVTLVKDFWVRAEIYDVDAAKDEELKAVIRDPSLKERLGRRWVWNPSDKQRSNRL